MGYSFRVNMFLLKVWSEGKEGAEGTAVCVRERREKDKDHYVF